MGKITELILFDWRKVFGFTSSGSSLVGKYGRKILSNKFARSGLEMGIVAVITAGFLIKNFSNIGGSSLLALNLAVVSPKPTIDATTVSSVQLPIDYVYESRGYSWFHSGADLVAPTGTRVKPIMDGIVEEVNHFGTGYGNHVIIKHDGGYESIYGHLSETEVRVGEKVGLNTELGKSGSTGFSTGPHLHLELRLEGTPINPADIVPGIQ